MGNAPSKGIRIIDLTGSKSRRNYSNIFSRSAVEGGGRNRIAATTTTTRALTTTTTTTGTTTTTTLAPTTTTTTLSGDTYFYPFTFTGGTLGYRNIGSHGMTFSSSGDTTMHGFTLYGSSAGTAQFRFYEYDAEFTYEDPPDEKEFVGDSPYLGTALISETLDIVEGANEFIYDIAVTGTSLNPKYYWIGFDDIDVGATGSTQIDGLRRHKLMTELKPFDAENGIQLLDSRNRISNYDYDLQDPVGVGETYYYFYDFSFYDGLITTTTTTQAPTTTTTIYDPYFYPFAFEGGSDSYSSNIDWRGVTFASSADTTFHSIDVSANAAGGVRLRIYKFDAEFTKTGDYFDGQDPDEGVSVLDQWYSVDSGSNELVIDVATTGSTSVPTYFWIGISEISGSTSSLLRTSGAGIPFDAVSGIELLDARTGNNGYDSGDYFYWSYDAKFTKSGSVTTTTTTTTGITTTTTTTGVTATTTTTTSIYYYPFAFAGGSSGYSSSVDDRGMTFTSSGDSVLNSFTVDSDGSGQTRVYVYKYDAEFTETGSTGYFDGDSPNEGTLILDETYDLIDGENTITVDLAVTGTTGNAQAYWIGVDNTTSSGLLRSSGVNLPFNELSYVRLMDSRSRLSNYSYDGYYYFVYNAKFSNGVTGSTGVTTTTTLSSSEIHKLSLGESDNTFEGTELTWQNVGKDGDSAPLILLDQNGDDQGLRFIIPEDTISENVRKQTLWTEITSGNVSFPDDILLLGVDSYGAFISDDQNGVLRISGLTTGSTYSFEVFSTLNSTTTGWSVSDSDYTGLILSGGTATGNTGNINPIGNTGNTITLENTSNDLGIIDLHFTGDEDWDHPVINAMIITKT